MRDLRDGGGVAQVDGNPFLGTAATGRVGELARRRPAPGLRRRGIPDVGQSLGRGGPQGPAPPVQRHVERRMLFAEGLPLVTLNVKDYIDFTHHHQLQLITG